MVLIVLFLAVSLFQIGSYLTHRAFINQVKLDKGALLAELAHQMAGEMDKGIFERLREIEMVASLPMLADPKVPLDIKQAFLEKLQSSYKNYAWIGIADPEGNIVVGTHNVLVGKSVAKRSWFLDGAKGPAVGDVHDAFLLAKILPKPEYDFLPLRLLDISAPIIDTQGKLIGVVCGHLSWDWSFQVKNALLAPLKEHDNVDILILGKEGQVLLGTPELHQLTEKLMLPSVSSSRLGTSGFLTETWPDNKTYLTGFSPSPGYSTYTGLGWTVLVRQPADQAFAVANELNRRGIAVSIGFAFLFAVVLWLISGRMTRPMQRIAKAAAQIHSGGKLDDFPVVKGTDEIAVLSQSLADMVRTLQSQKEDLSEKNRNLVLAAQVFSANTEGIIITDENEHIVSINDAYSKITGYQPEDVISKTPRIVSSGIQSKAFYESMWESILKEGRWQGEVLNRRKNGDVYPEWLMISRILNEADGKNYYIGIISDITERKATEDELRKLALAVEQTPASVVITNIDAMIEYVNEAFVKATGYSREEAIGQNPRILQSGSTAQAIYKDLWATLTEGNLWKGEFKNKRKDGSEYVEFATIAPIRTIEGKTTHYVAIKQDITDRKRLEAELDEHRQHLESLVDQRTKELRAALEHADAANMAKSAFLANMSHEIRTPLNAITGMAHLIRRSGISEEQQQRLDKIDIAGQHLLEVINAVLDLSKIESGKLDLEIAPLNVRAIVKNAVSMIAAKVREKHLEIFEDVSLKNAVFSGDALRLQQALLNYLTNAIKFTDYGRISIRVSQLAEETASVLLRFEVEDSGIGLATDAIDKVFSPFEQADSSTTRKYGGTGLGLAITKHLAHLMGGEVGVQSQPGTGSTFWLTARLQKISPSQQKSAINSEESAEIALRREFPNARILLAEDEPVNQEVSLSLLNEIWPHVDVADNGREALSKAESSSFDLILMDMQMPEMDGLEATRRIRQLPNGSNSVILAMTANAFADDRLRCAEAGMNDFISKPVDPDMLFAKILAYLRSSAEVAE